MVQLLPPYLKYEIKFADRVRSCEDVILLEDRGVAVMGCDPGRERYNTVMVSRPAVILEINGVLLAICTDVIIRVSLSLGLSPQRSCTSTTTSPPRHPMLMP